MVAVQQGQPMMVAATSHPQQQQQQQVVQAESMPQRLSPITSTLMAAPTESGSVSVDGQSQSQSSNTLVALTQQNQQHQVNKVVDVPPQQQPAAAGVIGDSYAYSA